MRRDRAVWRIPPGGGSPSRPREECWPAPWRTVRHSPGVAGPRDGLQDMAMTGGPSPDADDHDAGAKPGLRASHEDGDRVVEILRVAAGDGRLTAAELDERLEAALTARTGSELAVLIDDLPGVAGERGGVAQQAKDLVRIDYQGGNTRRVGGWVVPQRMQIRAVGGTVRLDFTEAVIPEPTLQIEGGVRGGSLVLGTKPGIEVDADEVAVRGGRIKVGSGTGAKRPRTLGVLISGGGPGRIILARPPRRTFWQWLLHKPTPHYGAITTR